MKKILTVLFITFLIILTGCGKKESNTKYNIISTTFPGYDFARAVVKDSEDISVKMLLSPGGEIHDYDPTPQDIIDIKNCDLFIYVGGESDAWIEDILSDIDLNKTKVIKLMDLVNLYEEEIIEGMEEESHHEEEEVEYDEHIWTSPKNAIKIVEKLKEEIINIDNENSDIYRNNATNYINDLTTIDEGIREIVNNAKRRELVFGDRFPLRYFTEEYGLDYKAAFPGCSHETEASAKTLSYLIEYVKNNNIPVIFKIELSNGKIADTIAKETNAKVLEFHSAHNITKKDFDNGLTYIDFMKKNIDALSQALN